MGEAIEKTDPHFVRCIKPNPKNRPDDYDRKGVAEQLRYQGVLQVVQLSRAGYPVRTTMDDVWSKYKILVEKKLYNEIRAMDPIDRAKKLMARLDEKYEIPKTANGGPGVAVGKTKVFFRKEAYEKLQSAQLTVQNQAAVKIQKCVKGRQARAKYAMMKMCLIAIQAAARGFI